MTDKTTAPKTPSAEASQVVIQTNQHMVWGSAPDEALMLGINDVYGDETTDDFKAKLFAGICEATEKFSAVTVQAALDRAL